MAKPKAKPGSFESFEQISTRLDEIIGMVRDKNTSLERSLDLFDEALELGSAAVDLVDTTQFSPEEEARLADLSISQLSPSPDGSTEEMVGPAPDGAVRGQAASVDGDAGSTPQDDGGD